MKLDNNMLNDRIESGNIHSVYIATLNFILYSDITNYLPNILMIKSESKSQIAMAKK